MTDEIPGTTPGEVEGHVAPAEPAGEAPPSEIPVGVDALPAEAVAAAEERGGEDDDGGAIDMADVVAEGGDEARPRAATRPRPRAATRPRAARPTRRARTRPRGPTPRRRPRRTPAKRPSSSHLRRRLRSPRGERAPSG